MSEDNEPRLHRVTDPNEVARQFRELQMDQAVRNVVQPKPAFEQLTFLDAFIDSWFLDTSVGRVSNFLADKFGQESPYDENGERKRNQPFGTFNPYEQDLTGYEDYLQEFQGAYNPVEFARIKSRIDKNRRKRDQLEHNDIFWTRMLASVFDPVNLVAAPAVRGMGFFKAMRAGAGRNLMAVGAGEVATAPLDPTSRSEETVMNVAMGFGFASAFSGVAGLFKGQLGADAAARAEQRYVNAQASTRTNADPEVSRKANESAAIPSRALYDEQFRGVTGLEYDDWIRSASTGRHIDDGLERSDVRIVEANLGRRWVLRQNEDGTVTRYSWNRKEGLIEPEEFPSMQAAQRRLNSKAHKKVDSFNSVHSVIWRRSKREGFLTQKEIDEDTAQRTKAQNVSRDPDGFQIDEPDEFDLAFHRAIEMENEIVSFKKARDDLKKEAEEFEAETARLEARLNEKQAALDAAEKAGDKRKAGAQRAVITRERLVERVSNARQKAKWKRYQEEQAEGRIGDAQLRKKAVETTGDPDMWDMPGGAAFQALTEAAAMTGQFPWWNMIKNGLRKTAPRTAQMIQRTAWALSSSPGVHSRAGTQGESIGGSVEAMSKAWLGKYREVNDFTDAAYAKYAGWGDDQSTTQVWAQAQKQRIGQTFRDAKAKLTGTEASTTTSEGKMTLDEFRKGVGRILMGVDSKTLKMDMDESAFKQMNLAANKWRDMLNEFEKAGKEVGLFPTKEGVETRIFKTEARIEEISTDLVGIKAWRQKVLSVNPEERITVDRRTGKLRAWRTPEELDEIIERMEMQLARLEEDLVQSKEVADLIKSGENFSDQMFFYRMWDRDKVRANGDQLKGILRDHFTKNPFVLMGGRRVKMSTDPRDIQARVEEAYDQILGESEFGDTLGFHTVFGSNKHDKLKRKLDGMIERDKELAKRMADLEEGTEQFDLLKNEREVLARRRQSVETDISRGSKVDGGGPGQFLHRKIDIPNREVSEFIDQNVSDVMQQYAMRTAPMLEMARRFGDGRMDDHLYNIELNGLREILELGPKNAEKNLKELDHQLEQIRAQRDITLGNYGVPDDPSAITNRLVRSALALSTMSLMGRSVQMSMTDISKAVISRGLIRGFGDLFSYAAGVADKSSRWGLGAREVRLAGEAMERTIAIRLMQIHEVGGVNQYMSKWERKLFGEQGRFFMFNGMALWTDHAKQFAGTLAQSEIIRVAYKMVDGTATKKEMAAMSGAIDIDMAKRIVKEHSSLPADEQKLGSMFIANTEAWADPAVKRAFRAQLVDEVNRTVFTPGAVDKPKLMSTNIGRLVGQYHAFSFAVTNRLIAPGLQDPDKKTFAIITSMVAAGFLIDLMRSKDFGEMSIEDRIFRAVELSGVGGIFLDVNNMIEGASGHQLGIRASLGLQQPFNNSNWATRVGAVAGAAPSQYLNLAYAMFDDDATGHDQARALRYLIPYNNMIWWNDMAGRIQRNTGELLEDE